MSDSTRVRLRWAACGFAAASAAAAFADAWWLLAFTAACLVMAGTRK